MAISTEGDVTPQTQDQSLNSGQAGGSASTGVTEQIAQSQTTQPARAQNQQSQPPVQPQTKPVAAQPSTAQRHAGVFQSIMETLAGPQTRKKVLNPNTGAIEDDPNQPRRSRGQLANSIVAGALTGLFAGAGERGPGAGMRGAAAGFQANTQRIQQAQEQANRQPVEDMARKQAITENNLRMHQLALQTGMMDKNFIDTTNKPFTQMVDEIEEANPDAAKEKGVKEADIPALMQKYHVTRDAFVPYGEAIPRLGPDGKQATNADGTLAWDKTYAVIDPNVEIAIPDKTLEFLHSVGDHSFDKIPEGQAVRAHYVNAAITKAAQLQAFMNTGQKSQDLVTKGVPVAPLKDAEADSLVDKYAKQYGVDSNLVKRLIQQESSGQHTDKNGKITISKEGALGLMQLMPNTAKKYGIDPNDKEQNIKGGIHLMSDLLKKYDGDVNKALAEYNGGPKGVTNPSQETKDYVSKITSGYQPQEAKEGKTEEQTFNQRVLDGIKDKIISSNQLQTFYKYHSLLPEDATNAMRKDGVDAQTINMFVNLHGGLDAMHAQTEARKVQGITQEAQARADIEIAKKKTEEASEAELEKQNEIYLQRPSNTWKVQDAIPDYGAMDSLSLENSLNKEGVKTPPIMDYLVRLGHYKESPGSVPTIIRKGTFQMSRQQAMDYIGKFINPDYDVRKYEESNTFAKDLGKQAPNTSGGLVQAAGTAAQHIGDLDEATKALNNGNIQALNAIANRWGVETGKNAPVVFNAIAHKVITETEKVAYGGTPLENSLKQLDRDLNLRESKGQLAGVSDAYIGLMADRLNELDNKSVDLLGKHLPLSKAATNMFASHGYTFGPDGLTKPTQANLPKYTPGSTLSLDVVNQYVAASGGDKAKAKQALIANGWPQ
jgi:hypothetical protein